jgi:dienelactone hydrolase
MNSFRRMLCLVLLLNVASVATLIAADKTLPKTNPLTIEQPLDEFMVAGIDKFCLRELAASRGRRAMIKRDFSSREKYAKSIEASRKKFAEYIGVIDKRVAKNDFELIQTLDRDSVVGKSEKFTVHAVRWRVLDGFDAEGLVLIPKGGSTTVNVIAVPDADWTPEQFVGLEPGVNERSQIPRWLAEAGYTVLVPAILSRSSELSGNPHVAYTNQTHREFVYRQAFEMGRHVIGFEVQSILAAVDTIHGVPNARNESPTAIGVVGVGEGGLLAMYAAALDTRIGSTYVSGYFQKREDVWTEPIYRNVWGLLTEFGDAEIVGLIAPRQFVVEAAGIPQHAGPPATKPGRRGGAAPGRIETATLASVRVEYDRVLETYKKLKAPTSCEFFSSGEGGDPPGVRQAIQAFARGINSSDLPAKLSAITKVETPKGLPVPNVAADREKRSINQMQKFVQNLLRLSNKVRDKAWASGDLTSVDKWVKTAAPLRDWVYDEMIGRLPKSTMALNPRTRLVLDEKEFAAYEVVLDVYKDIVASGILLLPKDMKPGEKRPVVVCQHGLEGTPTSTMTYTDNRSFPYYKAFSSELCKRGFIVYAPQNPYRGRDRFRTLQRKSNPLKRSLFSYIIPQHERTLEWLGTLPNVDAKRIAFYGLSYGGKTAVRVPPMVDAYCLSICSADFNEWVKKNTSNEDRYSYLFTGEYEIFEWNMGHVANYAELSNLMVPRPFMVERGHKDGVAPDEWVAWEYAKIRRHYDYLNIGDRTEIEFFNGPHTINGQGTFRFLHKHLNWPEKK